MQVTKSSGVTETFEGSKIERVISWSTQNLNNQEYIIRTLMNSIRTHLYDGITTEEIQNNLVKLAADRISEQEPEYQYVAARLRMFGLRKQVYGGFRPISFYSLIKRNVERGVYDKEILEKWSKEEIDYLETHINHNLDMTFSYAGAMQLIEKYLVKDRSTGQIFETPQYAYMLIAMCLHQNEKYDRTLHTIKFYSSAAKRKFSLPTPIMGGVRTPTRQFSSCVLIESGDTLDSINRTNSCIVKYISRRAGIGILGGGIRAEGSKIRSGEVKHTGVIPFWKGFKSSVKSCSQGGIRGGSATLYYPFWHLEVEKLLVLKNNRGVEENRIRELDYGVQLNDFLFERYLEDEYITLFSPNVMGGELYDAFYSDKEKFKRLYEELENNPLIVQKRIKASDIIHQFAIERCSTGRVYPMFVDNANENSAFNSKVAPVKMSNLCAEITLPTEPVDDEDRDAGEIALCTLAAFNMGNVTTAELPELSKIIVRALDNLLDYQDYPVNEALKAKYRRSLGIGVVNYAYWLAKQGMRYSDGSGLKATHEFFESMQYWLLNASSDLAAERGACKYYDQTSYALGYLPQDRKQKAHDFPHLNYDLRENWDGLRDKIVKFGLRNSTLTAFMPSESSSQVLNATNGIEPPRGPVSTKGSKDGVFNQVVPEVESLGNLYEYAWEMAERGNKGYFDLCAVIQKWGDQSISANEYHVPEIYPKGKIPLTVLIKNLYYANRIGLKTLYYNNTKDGSDATEEVQDKPLPSIQDSIVEDDCEGCTI
tara:strand:- start:54633 stop:56930 length:2298 start_codon:yes stop_codon:yes gene_type:complete